MELDSTNYWYRDRLAALYLSRGETDAAVAGYESMMKAFPKKTNTYYQMVNIYMQRGEIDKGLAMIDEIEKFAGKSDPTVMTRYRILLSRQKQEEALKVLEDYSEEYSSPQVLSMLGDHHMGMFSDSLALAYYDEALSLDKDYAPALIGKSEVFRMTRRFPRFFSTLGQVMSNQEAAPEAKADYMSELTNRSDPRFLQLYMPQIDSVWNEAASVHPADSAIQTGKGVWYYRTGRVKEAADIFGAYAKAAPEKLPARLLWLQVLGESGDYDTLEKATEEAVRDFPDQIQLLEMISVARYNRKDYEGVIANCERMIKAAPKDSAICLSAWSTMGDMYHSIGRKDKCMKAYAKALKINPDYAPVLNNYAWYLALDGVRLNLAEKMSRKCIQQEPDNATYLDTYGWILHLQGKDEQAKPIFKHAMLYGGKDSAVTLSHYARVLEKLGETDLAKIYRNQARAKAAESNEEVE